MDKEVQSVTKRDKFITINFTSYVLVVLH